MMMLPKFRALGVGAVALFASAACQSGPAAPPGGGGRGGFPAIAVKVQVARPTTVEDASAYVASLKSLHSTAIKPQVEGQITAIYVRSGERVATGAPLVQIDPQRQQAAVSSQDAQRVAKESDVAFARSQLARARELFDAGAISRQEYEQAETALHTAEAQLTSLKAQLQQQEVQLRYFTVTAPATGVIGDVPVRVGNQVSTQTTLTTVEQNDTMELYVSVPVERTPDLHLGLPVQIVDPNGTRLAETSISFVSPSVDTQTQSILAKCVVRNPTGTLRSDQVVRARVVWRTTQALLLPVVALSRISGQYFAFVAEPKGNGLVATQRSIKVGQVLGDNYVVLEGLKPGDNVIVAGVQKLVDGAPVAPTP